MSAIRRKHKVALTALRGDAMVVELAARFGVPLRTRVSRTNPKNEDSLAERSGFELSVPQEISFLWPAYPLNWPR
jgi:hypothetical protein